MEQSRYEEIGDLLSVDERTNTIEIEKETGIESLPVGEKSILTLAKMMVGSRVRAVLDPETKFVTSVSVLETEEPIFRVKKEKDFEPERPKSRAEEEPPSPEKKSLPWERPREQKRYTFVRTPLTPAEKETRKECLKMAVELFISLNKKDYDFESMDWRSIREQIGRKVVAIAREFEEFLTYRSERKEDAS